jgi:hypothetical protein
MREFADTEKGWIEYRCIEELAYRTKGPRLPFDKLKAPSEA